MSRDIDKLADSISTDSVQSKFKDRYLSDRPKQQWPAYIDEIALDKAYNPEKVSIGGLSLTSDDFGTELGPLYWEGLREFCGEDGLPTGIANETESEFTGSLAYRLAELEISLGKADSSLQDLGRATDAFLQKLIQQRIDDEFSIRNSISTQNGSEIILNLFDHSTVVEHSRDIKDILNSSKGRKTLLEVLDEPRMRTVLWDHQRDALSNWVEAGCRGYVDMATATGKTVLGLSVIAHRYGTLHQEDIDRVPEDPTREKTSSEKDDILIVANRNLILEQWRREFDHHLRIPPERTKQDDDEIIRLSWGRIHFRTSQSFLNNETSASLDQYDLVILDEAHNYAGDRKSARLLQEIDGDALALSGSIDNDDIDSERVLKHLSEGIGQEVGKLSIKEAKERGVIPEFDWNVVYTPVRGGCEDLERLTKSLSDRVDWFRKEQKKGELGVTTDRSLARWDDLRIYANNTSEGQEKRRSNEDFRDFAIELGQRWSERMNRMAQIEAVIQLIRENEEKKIVLMVPKNNLIKILRKRLNEANIFGNNTYTILSTQSRSKSRDVADEFNDSKGGAVLIGTGDKIGEGLDVPNAEVGINLATGSVNTALIQRIGRVLRRGDGSQEKSPAFYNLLALPTSPEARIPDDGLDFIEGVSDFRTFGRQMDQPPRFIRTKSSVGVALQDLETQGIERLDSLLLREKYEKPEKDTLRRATFDETVDMMRNHTYDSEQSSATIELWGASLNETYDSPSEVTGSAVVEAESNNDIFQSQEKQMTIEDSEETIERPEREQIPREESTSNSNPRESNSRDQSGSHWSNFRIRFQDASGDPITGLTVDAMNERYRVKGLPVDESGWCEIQVPRDITKLEVSLRISVTDQDTKEICVTVNPSENTQHTVAVVSAE